MSEVETLQLHAPGTIPAAEEIAQSGRGMYDWLGVPYDPAAWPKSGDLYRRNELWWRHVEPTRGAYNFAPVETSLADARTAGGRAGIRIMPMGNWGEPKHHPDWVPTGTGNAPLQNHTTYITGWCDMVGALGAQFNGDPRLHFIDLSGGGAWGEYHWDDAWGVEITPANALTIAQATIAAFPDTYILAPAVRPYMDNAIALAPNVGWRFDFAGGMPLTLAGTPMQDRWKTAPVVTEWAPDPASFTTALALDNVRSMHISMVSSGNKPLLTSAMTAPDRAVFEQAVRETGHRYTLTTLAVPHKATAGTTHTVTVTLRNDGVAPTYDTWRTDLVLTHATSGAAHTIPLSGVNARTCVGGGSVVSYDSTITLPAEPGWYQASVRITDVKTTYLPPARLANTGRDPSGAYPMGDLQILPALEAPMTSITVLTPDWFTHNPPTGGGGGGQTPDNTGIIMSGPYTLDPKRTPPGSVVLLPAGTTVMTHVGNRFTGTPGGQTPSAASTALSGSLPLTATGSTQWKFADIGMFGESIQLTTTATATDMMACTATFPAGISEIQISVVCLIPEPTSDTAIIAVYRTAGAQEFRALIKPGTTAGTSNIIFDDSKTAGSWNWTSPNFTSGSRIRIAIALSIGAGSTGRQKGAIYVVNADGSETQVGTTYEVTAVTTPATDVYTSMNFGKLTNKASLEDKVLQMDSIRVAYGPGAYETGFLAREQLYPAAV